MAQEDLLEKARRELAGASAAEVLAWADARFGERAGIASSFGVEDVTLIDLAARHAPRLRVFTLDTGRLHPETYQVMEEVRRRYRILIESYFPERAAVEQYAREHSLPVNPLHAQGYPSIGCAPCTRPIQPGEDVRAGRWWWESPEHKECGLHPSSAPKAGDR